MAVILPIIKLFLSIWQNTHIHTSLLFFLFFFFLSLSRCFLFLLGVALRKRAGFSDLKREKSRKQDMGYYGWSRNFDPSRGIGAVDDGRVLGYP